MAGVRPQLLRELVVGVRAIVAVGPAPLVGSWPMHAASTTMQTGESQGCPRSSSTPRVSPPSLMPRDSARSTVGVAGSARPRVSPSRCPRTLSDSASTAWATTTSRLSVVSPRAVARAGRRAIVLDAALLVRPPPVLSGAGHPPIPAVDGVLPVIGHLRHAGVMGPNRRARSLPAGAPRFRRAVLRLAPSPLCRNWYFPQPCVRPRLIVGSCCLRDSCKSTPTFPRPAKS